MITRYRIYGEDGRAYSSCYDYPKAMQRLREARKGKFSRLWWPRQEYYIEVIDTEIYNAKQNLFFN